MADLLLKLLDALFKDGASGELLFSRVAVLVIVVFIGFIWFKGEAIMNMYKDSRYSTYTAILQKEQNAKFDTTVQEQLQYAYVSSGADFTGLYTFRPANLNYFVDLLSYQGKLPSVVDSKNLGGFPIDRGSEQYETESGGGYYISPNGKPGEYVYLPSKIKRTPEINYSFSCPYFNLANVYSGAVELYWYGDKTPDIPVNRLYGICGQAARAIGRAK